MCSDQTHSICYWVVMVMAVIVYKRQIHSICYWLVMVMAVIMYKGLELDLGPDFERFLCITPILV